MASQLSIKLTCFLPIHSCNADITRAPNTDSVFMSDLPFLHSGGQEFTMTLSFYTGAKVVIITMYTDMEYKFHRFVQAIEKYKVCLDIHLSNTPVCKLQYFITVLCQSFS